MNRLGLLVFALAGATCLSVGNLYLGSAEMFPSRVATASKSVVMVVTLGQDPVTKLIRPSGKGSGVFVRPNAILTCAHVVKGAALVAVMTEDKKVHPAYVSVVHPQDDLAIVTIKDVKGHPARLGKPLIQGQAVFAVGNPGPFTWLVTAGIVSALEPLLISDVVINPGSSGGGLFNMKAELVGISRAITLVSPEHSYQGHSIFVAGHQIRAILTRYDRLEKEGKI